VQQQQRPEQGGVEYQDGKRQGTAQSIGHPPNRTVPAMPAKDWMESSVAASVPKGPRNRTIGTICEVMTIDR